MKRTAILLDIDDTILDFHKAESIALAETLRRIGIEPLDSTLKRYSEINITMWEKLERQELTRQQVLENRFDVLFDELGYDCTGAKANSIYEVLLSKGHYFIPGAPELLEALFGKYDLYIVSNGSGDIQDSRIKSAGIAKYFKGIFISERIGADKPGREFFNRCIAMMDAFDPDRAIIVGDSLTSDIQGGINAGIKTCWFNPKGKPGRDDIRPDYEISALSQLPELLENIFDTIL